MKHRLHTWVGLMLFASIFFSCKKEQLSQGNATEISVAINNVNVWLAKVKQKLNSARNSVPKGSVAETRITNNIANIDLLTQNLRLEETVKSIVNDKYNLLTVPINDTVNSLKNVNKRNSLHLAMVTDKHGKIISGNIICFVPKNNDKRQRISANTIAKFLTLKADNDSGTLRFLSMTGQWLRQIEFKNNEVVSYGVVTSGKTKNGLTTSALSCIDWYLVTTYYNFATGETTTTEEFLGTTCQSCDNSDYQNLCSDIGSGGGGGSEDVSSSDSLITSIDETSITDYNDEEYTYSDTEEENNAPSGFSGPGSNGALMGSGYYPPIMCYEKASKQVAWQYPAGPYVLISVKMDNTTVLNSPCSIVDSWGYPGVRTVETSGHNNKYWESVLPLVLFNWRCFLHSLTVTDDGRSWPGFKAHSRMKVE